MKKLGLLFLVFLQLFTPTAQAYQFGQTTTQRTSSTPATGQAVLDTTQKAFYLGDGSTLGGNKFVGATSNNTAISGLTINAYGDSLTAGNQDGLQGPWPLALQTALGNGYTVNNYGIGGQLSTQIAIRAGGVSLPVTMTGNVVSSGAGLGTAIALTALNGAAIAGTSTANDPDYRFLSNSGNNNATLLYGTLCGVHGLMKRTATGGPPSTAETYTFAGSSLPHLANQACAANSVFTPDGSRFAAQPFIYEGGRNNYANGTTVESDATSMASYASAAGNPNYLFLTILNGDYSGEQSGQSGYNQIIAINSYLSSNFTGHVWDWRAWLITQYNSGNPVDVLNHTNDVVPYTLRAVIGAGTLNGSITSSGCPTLTPTNGVLSAAQTLKVDSEYIYVLTSAGNVVSTCTRGYGTGGVAASHSNGAAYTLTDPLHISSSTDTLVGNYIAANYATLLTPSTISNSFLTPETYSFASAFTPLALGNWNSPQYVNGDLIVNGSIIIYNGNSVFGYSAAPGGQPINLIGNASSNIAQVGGGNVGSICFGTGGPGGTCAQASGNDGDFANAKSYLDQSYSYQQPTTGTTVIMADTSDIAIIDPSGTLATLTIQLPTCSSTYSGKVARFTSTQIISALTVTATAGSIVDPPSSLAVGGTAGFICRNTNTTWFRIQ